MLDRDWTTTELAGEHYEHTAFRDADMTEPTNRGATFTERTFSGVEFNVSTHTEAAFLNCAFTRCTFFNATFTPTPHPEVPYHATKVEWRRASAAKSPDVERAANRYGVHWGVAPNGERSAVLTGDTESYAGRLEGPWPFVAKLITADSVVEVVDHFIDKLIARTIERLASA